LPNTNAVAYCFKRFKLQVMNFYNAGSWEKAYTPLFYFLQQKLSLSKTFKFLPLLPVLRRVRLLNIFSSFSSKTFCGTILLFLAVIIFNVKSGCLLDLSCACVCACVCMCVCVRERESFFLSLTWYVCLCVLFSLSLFLY
jgi:hypothetical protein